MAQPIPGRLFLTCAASALFLVTGWAAGSPPAGEAEAGSSSDERLETLLTRSGRSYRGRVVGYDSEKKSYLFLAGGNQISLPEAEILTIRSPGEAAGPADPISARQAPVSPDLSPAKPEVRSATPSEEGEDSKLEKAPLKRGEPAGLEALISGYRALPAPKSPEALQALEEAMESLRAGLPLAALEPLKRAVQAEPASAAAALLLAAVHLEAEKDPEAAYPLLVTAGARVPDCAAARSLLIRAARMLGYRRFLDRLEAEAIERAAEGAERQYRLFQRFQGRDPQRALAAWTEYRQLDPRWERVASPEGRKLRRAQEALERGEATAAAGLLTSAIAENPLVEPEAKPLLVRALSARAERAREAGRLELALADLTALADEAPERKTELEGKARQVEAALLKQRFQSASTAEEAEAALSALSTLVPGLETRFKPEIAEGFAVLARNALPREGFEAALRALKARKGRGEECDPQVLLGCAELVSRDIAGGDLARGRERLRALEELAGSGEGLRSRLKDLQARLAQAEPAPPAAGSARGEPAEPAQSPYLPLRPGSRWTYLHGDGSREVQKLERVEKLEDGRTVFRFSTEFQLAEARIPYLKTGYFSGEFFQTAAGSRAAGGELTLKLPAVVGDHWSWRRGDISFEREYAATDAKVVCRAGSFESCLKVKATSRFEAGGVRSRPVVQWFYYAPQVGLVKIEGETHFDGRELEEYLPPSGPPPAGQPSAGPPPATATREVREPAQAAGPQAAGSLEGALGGAPAGR